MTLDDAKTLLKFLCFDSDGDDDDATPPFTINLNDAFYWASADGETIPEECLVEVATLFYRYGINGVYYWALKRRGEDKVEFSDVNRGVEFVRHEERIRAEVPDDSKRAYHREAYKIG